MVKLFVDSELPITFGILKFKIPKVENADKQRSFLNNIINDKFGRYDMVNEKELYLVENETHFIIEYDMYKVREHIIKILDVWHYIIGWKNQTNSYFVGKTVGDLSNHFKETYLSLYRNNNRNFPYFDRFDYYGQNVLLDDLKKDEFEQIFYRLRLHFEKINYVSDETFKKIRIQIGRELSELSDYKFTSSIERKE